MSKFKEIFTFLLLSLLCSSMIESIHVTQQKFGDELANFDNEDEGLTNEMVQMNNYEDIDNQKNENEELVEDQFSETDNEATVESEDEFSHLEDEENSIEFSSESRSNNRGSPTRMKVVEEPLLQLRSN